MRARLGIGLALLLGVLAMLPLVKAGWGVNASRLIVNKAVDTLPGDLRPFYEANRGYLMQHVNDPLEQLAKSPADKKNHFIRLDHYGQFPYTNLPRDYKSAVVKFSKRNLETYGLLPWEVGVYSERLTNAFRARDWDSVRVASAALAY